MPTSKSRTEETEAGPAPDTVNWDIQLELLHAAGGRVENEDFVAVVCGALA